jgi:probable F420-dependent oxidoreductase
MLSRIGVLVKFGIGLAQVHRSQWLDMTRLCEDLGFESVWFPDHLVFTEAMSGSPYTGDDHPPVPPTTPLYEPLAYLSYLAAQTQRVRLGTFVYLFGLRHPFLSARAFATLDEVSGGRAEAGVGSGWLAGEWDAVGWDFHTRGRRLDEAIDVAKRLWTEDVIEHHGEFFSFPPVVFEPKPVQRPYPPLLVGGESVAALRRAVVRGDGWISMPHTFESAAPQLALLDRLCAEAGRSRSSLNVTVTDQGLIGPEEVARWEEARVDRLIVKPYLRTRDALDGVRRFRERCHAWF